MITKKQNRALIALNSILVLARALAYEGKSDDVAYVLDVAEYLPLLMLDPADKTDEFRQQLVTLADKYPNFTLAIERFDAPDQS